MSLAAIPGKRLPVQVPASGAINAVLDAIYAAGQSATYFDTSARTPGAGIAHNPARYQNAGTTEAVYASLPTGAYAWLLAGNAAGTAATMASPDTQAASRLLGGVCKTPGAFNAWTNASPFTTGTWFGYWRSVNCASVTVAKVHCWETAETWLVVLEDNTGAMYTFEVGCWLDPESTHASDAESDGRLAGVRTSGATAITASFTTSVVNTNNWLNHTTTDGQAHSGVWQPGTSTLWPVYRQDAPGISTTTSALSPSGEYRRWRPKWWRNQAAPNDRLLGVDRTVAHFRDGKFGIKHATSGGTEIGWAIGGSATTDQDVVLYLS